MYQLVRASFNNWYALQGRDIDLARATGLLGPTGVGKSAVLDGLQTVMSGCNHNILDLNAAAGGSKSRTIRDYILGCITDVDGGRPSRPSAEATLALTFRDTGTGRCIALLLLMTADERESREEVAARIVARGCDFRIADFIERNGRGEEFVASHEAMLERLRTELGPRNVLQHPTSTRFVADYLQAMRPRLTPDPQRFLKNFAYALAAKEFDDATDFVHRFVLERQPLNVERVRESIRTWRELEEEAKRLEEMLAAIRVVRGRFGTWARQHVQAQTAEFLQLHLKRRDLEFDSAEQGALRRAAGEQAAVKQTLIDNHAAAITRLSDELERLRALQSQSQAAAMLAVIDSAEKGLSRNRATLHKALAAGIAPFTQAAQLDRLRRFMPHSAHPRLESARNLAGLVGGRPPDRWLAEAEAVPPLLRAVSELPLASDSLRAQRDALTAELPDLKARASALKRQIDAAGPGGALLSPHVRDFMQLLRREHIEAVPLPEVVDISDDRWTFALEALLGANREALIVPAGQARDAFDLLYRRRNEFHGCRLVNTRRTARQAPRVPSGSIAEIVRTDNADALVFIQTQVARFVRVDSEAALDDHEHAILPNAKSSSGLSLRVHRDQRTILGAAARAKAIRDAAEDHEELSGTIREKDAQLALLNGALDVLARLHDVDIQAIEAQITEAQGIEAELKGLERQRGTVETEDDRMLRQSILDTMQERAGYEQETRELQAELVQLQAKMGMAQLKLEDNSRQIRKLEGQEAAVAAPQESEEARWLIDQSESLDHSIGRARLHTENELGIRCKGRERAFLAARLAEVDQELPRLRQSRDTNANRARNEFADFLQRYVGPSPLPPEADNAMKYMWAVRRELQIADNELRPHRDAVGAARAEMENALKEDLLTKLGEKFRMVDSQIRTLNARLSNHPFVGQTYRFSKSVNLRLAPVHDLVVKVAGHPEMGLLGLQNEADGMTESMKTAMAQIERILTEDTDDRLFEDYRKYFEFELNVVDANGRAVPFSSVVGKMSGGQRQAPYYVAIAASMMSACYPQAKPGDTDGLGLVVFDEAFNKLDIPNTRRLLELYAELGLQVVVAAPEEKRASFLEVMDTIINVNRLPNTDQVFIDVKVIGPRAKDEMERQNPEHLGLEDFRRRLRHRSTEASA